VSNPTTDLINRFYYGFICKQPEYTELVDAAYRTGVYETQDEFDRRMIVLIRQAYTAGARWEFRASAELSPHIAKFLEMVVLLGPDPGKDDWLTEPYEHIDGPRQGSYDPFVGPRQEPYDPPLEERDDIPF
jgi:hypothetical protein